MFFYALKLPFSISVWPNTFNISPRAIDIGYNVDYGVLVGYCQLTPSIAIECGCIIQLNTSWSQPKVITNILIRQDMKFSWSDIRSTDVITQSRIYSAQSMMSVSISWGSRRILIGVPWLNIVLLYAFDNVSNPIGTYDNGMDSTGFGKSVAWLDVHGNKALILANWLSRSTTEWVSSSVQMYDIESDGFSSNVQPISIYPNSQQQIFSKSKVFFIRLMCSISGDFITLDSLGGPSAVFSAPAGSFPDTNVRLFRSVSVPCIRGTNRDYAGIELCIPCPHGTFSSGCQTCNSNASFCPFGSVEELPYSTFQSIDQVQEYPDSPENTVFDDILLHNMFMLNWQSSHCALVSPMTWVLLFIVFGIIVALIVIISEIHCANQRNIHYRIKRILKNMDLIGEGELWIGGLLSVAVIVLVISACTFSAEFYHQYPIENMTDENSFACDVTLRNSKFSTNLQTMPQHRSSNKQIQPMFDLISAQQFYLKIDLIQTAFTCQDSLTIYHVMHYKLLVLPIAKCETSYNSSILSLTVSLPAQEISVQLILSGLKTVGAIRLGLIGPSASSTDGRYTLLELNFASTFTSSLVDQVLAPSSLFSLQLTPIINQTAPLSTDGLTVFSAIWSSSYDVKTSEIFNTENRYTFFKRIQTSVNVTIAKTVFYVNNIQEPIAKQTEIIFRNFLFIFLVLEAFGLLVLVVKLLIVPPLRTFIVRCRKSTEQSQTDHNTEMNNVSRSY
ncbi:unnamed protein product [Rotaria magnacalcarata]|uniref:Uncharacterized protein n=3 Tax=Rotaria magnacalcarata TaxID=392030 RepID=A0A815I571_9BILA|nr:unnamed protein product [Rotaria magnacalcarata]